MMVKKKSRSNLKNLVRFRSRLLPLANARSRYHLQVYSQSYPD